MSILDQLTEEDVSHLKDPAWHQLTSELSSVPGWKIVEALGRADWTQISREPRRMTDGDIAKTIRQIKETTEVK